MASNLFWFYDILIIGIALIFLYVGAKRGLMRSVVLVVLTVASIGISLVAANIVAPMIYDGFIKEPITAALSDALGKLDPVSVVSDAISDGDYGVELTDDEVQDVISDKGDFFENIAKEIKNNGASESSAAIESGMEESVTDYVLKQISGSVASSEWLTKMLDSVSGAKDSLRNAVSVFIRGNLDETVTTVEEKIISPAVKLVIKGIILIVMMIILMFVSHIIANAFKGFNKIPIIGPVNSILGAALGLAEGLVLIYLITQIVRLICYFTSGSLMFLNTETVQETFLFKHLFNFDVMSLIG